MPRIKTIAPLHLTPEELARRQERYNRQAPPPLQMMMANLPADESVPRSLGDEAACRASDQYVYEEAMRTDASAFDAIFLDCVLDPSSETLERDAPLPVFSILKLSASYLASLGHRLAAVTRNKVIAEELEHKLTSYGLAESFHGTIVLDLSFEAVADDAKWNAALANAVDEAAGRGATALINGCSAVNVREKRSSIVVVDPTELALELVGMAVRNGLVLDGKLGRPHGGRPYGCGGVKELRQLAEFVAATRFHDLPTEVVERAKGVLRDTAGVIIGGIGEPENGRLAAYALEHHPGQATLFGHGGKVSPAWAALVHGTAGTSLELDEGHAFAKGHAAIHAAPTALALAEAHDVSGEETLTAFILGYEVAARAGVATQLRTEVHPFGAWGVLGAAAVAGRLGRLEPEELAGVFELAASYAINPSFASAFQGANVRNTYAGMVNRLGLLAADFYELGFRGEQGGVQTTFGTILGKSFEPDALADGLGERYEIMRGYFKPYSACRYTHGAVEATLALRKDLDGRLESIERITVETYDIAATLTETQPETPLAGRFSLPHVVAACLVLGHATRDAFTLESLQHPQVRELAARVTVSEDAEFSAMTPARRPSRVTLHLQDGERLEHTVYGSKGDPDQPMTVEELKAKFTGLVAPSLGAEATAGLWEAFDRLETQPSFRRLSQTISLGRRKWKVSSEVTSCEYRVKNIRATLAARHSRTHYLTIPSNL